MGPAARAIFSPPEPPFSVPARDVRLSQRRTPSIKARSISDRRRGRSATSSIGNPATRAMALKLNHPLHVASPPRKLAAAAAASASSAAFFAAPPVAGVRPRSPRFLMASTLRSDSRSVASVSRSASGSRSFRFGSVP